MIFVSELLKLNFSTKKVEIKLNIKKK